MSPSTPQVSVVIPCHNNDRYVGECIDSVLSQTGVDVEVIVVDDGSTDESRSVIQSYGDRIRPLFQKQSGACAARNAGLAMVGFDTVLFLDSDDRLVAGNLGTILLQVGANPVKYSYYGRAVYIDAGGKRTGGGDQTCLPEEVSSIAGLIGQNILTGRVVHYTQNVRDIGGFDESLPRGQEFDLHVRMALHGVQFRSLGEDILEYRRHQSSTRISGGGFRGQDPLYYLVLHRKHREMLHQQFGASWPPDIAPRMARRLWEIGRGLLRENDAKTAMNYFQEARSLTDHKFVPGPKAYRTLVQLVGPRWAEKVASLKSRLRSSS